MITDSKFVKGVKSNAPKKGYKIEWVDGKYDNIFDESWLPLLDEAQKTNRLVTYEKEKNDAGYWNIKTLVLAEINEEPEKDDNFPFPDTPAVKTTPKKQISDRDKLVEFNRLCSMSLSYSKDSNLKLLELGHIKAGDLESAIKAMADSNVDWFMSKLTNYL